MLRNEEFLLHEMSIAQGLIDIVKGEMTKNGSTVLRSISLRVGRMSSIVPGSLTFCFEAMIAGTGLEGAELKIEITPLTGRCGGCGREFDIRDSDFSCPSCGDGDIDIISGQEISIPEIEVD